MRLQDISQGEPSSSGSIEVAPWEGYSVSQVVLGGGLAFLLATLIVGFLMYSVYRSTREGRKRYLWGAIVSLCALPLCATLLALVPNSRSFLFPSVVAQSTNEERVARALQEKARVTFVDNASSWEVPPPFTSLDQGQPATYMAVSQEDGLPRTCVVMLQDEASHRYSYSCRK